MKRYFNAINPERRGTHLFRNRTFLEYELAYDYAYFTVFLGAANSLQVRTYMTSHS
jgi:hypothetical protein